METDKKNEYQCLTKNQKSMQKVYKSKVRPLSYIHPEIIIRTNMPDKSRQKKGKVGFALQRTLPYKN